MTQVKEYNFANWNPGKHADYERIGICPECGRVGQFHCEPGGGRWWVHKMTTYDSNGNHEKHWEDYCTLEESPAMQEGDAEK